jgi:hypothetical protein
MDLLSVDEDPNGELIFHRTTIAVRAALQLLSAI